MSTAREEGKVSSSPHGTVDHDQEVGYSSTMCKEATVGFQQCSRMF